MRPLSTRSWILCTFATSGTFAVNPKTRAAPSATGGDALGDDEVDRDVVGPLTDTRLLDPDARLDVSSVLGHQVEVRSCHRGFKRRGLAEQARVDGQVAVGGEGCDRLVKDGGTGVEVDGLGAGDDERVAVRGESNERVEQDASRRDVLGSRSGQCTHVAPTPNGGMSARAGARQADSFAASQVSTASPSAGMRPLPARQSSATCVGDT